MRVMACWTLLLRLQYRFPLLVACRVAPAGPAMGNLHNKGYDIDELTKSQHSPVQIAILPDLIVESLHDSC